MTGGWITHAGRLQQQYQAAAGLLEKLMATVRPEFRADELVFDPADPVFGGATCRVASCQRTARGGWGLCGAHHDRWTAEGRPDLDAFAASTSPRWRRQCPLPRTGLRARRPPSGLVHASLPGLATGRMPGYG